MLILSLFFMATAKIITTKQKDKPKSYAGFYECIQNGSNWEENGTSRKKNDGSCTYIPPNKKPPIVLVYKIENGNVQGSEPITINKEQDLDSIISTGVELNDYSVNQFCEDLLALNKSSKIADSCNKNDDDYYTLNNVTAWYVVW